MDSFKEVKTKKNTRLKRGTVEENKTINIITGKWCYNKKWCCNNVRP